MAKRTFKQDYARYKHGFKEINENVKRVPQDVTKVMSDYSHFLGTAKSAKKALRKHTRVGRIGDSDT
jgi:hypothetical protein